MNRQGGFSLVEQLIGSTLGLVMLCALGNAVLQGSRSYREDEARSRVDAEARFALAQLSADLEMAGWWGGARGPETIRIDGTAIGIGGDCATPLAEAMRITATRPACITSAEFEGGDVVAIQRVSAEPVSGATQAGHAYLAVEGARGVLFRATPGRPTPAGVLYEYRPSMWYLRRYTASSSESPRVPALCRKVLSSDSARMQADSGGCIAQGITELRVVPEAGNGTLRLMLTARLREAGRNFERALTSRVLARNALWQVLPRGLP